MTIQKGFPAWDGSEVLFAYITMSDSKLKQEICDVFLENEAMLSIIDEKSMIAYWKVVAGAPAIATNALTAVRALQALKIRAGKTASKIAMVLSYQVAENGCNFSFAKLSDRRLISNALSITAEIAKFCIRFQIEVAMTELFFKKVTVPVIATKIGTVNLSDERSIAIYRLGVPSQSQKTSQVVIAEATSPAKSAMLQIGHTYEITSDSKHYQGPYIEVSSEG